MNYSGLSTKLKLAYAPLSSHDFAIVKSEKIIQEILNGSMLYVIAQRPLLTFENVNKSEDGQSLQFEIAQQGTGIKVKCSLPIYQELLGQDETKFVDITFGSYDKNWSQTGFPLTNVNGFQFHDHNGNFLLWLSPDKFLHHFFNEFISASVDGDYSELTKFNVHYVGKATDQEIWKRLTGHSALQDILSLEEPYNYGTLPPHEIVLLLFRVVDKFQITTLIDDVESFVDDIYGKNYPTDKEVSLDAEKILIKVLNPEYNERKFPNYPVSKDGLFKFKYNRFAYQISENITFVYSDGEIICNIDVESSDIIAIEENKTLSIFR